WLCTKTRRSWPTRSRGSSMRHEAIRETQSQPSTIMSDGYVPYVYVGTPALLQSAPVPIRQVLLKIHSRCNLRCDYCYVYEHVDQGGRRQPLAMSKDIGDCPLKRIAKHPYRPHTPFIPVIFQGGDPPPAGPALTGYAPPPIRTAVPATTRVNLNIQ